MEETTIPVAQAAAIRQFLDGALVKPTPSEEVKYYLTFSGENESSLLVAFEQWLEENPGSGVQALPSYKKRQGPYKALISIIGKPCDRYIRHPFHKRVYGGVYQDVTLRSIPTTFYTTPIPEVSRYLVHSGLGLDPDC